MDTLTVDGLTVAFRPAAAQDEGFVFSGWLEAHRKHGDWPRRLSSRRYFDEHKVTIAKLLATGSTIVAYNLARPGQVFGFICWRRGNEQEREALHWLYVKQVYRRNGIARELLAQAFGRGNPGTVVCSHWTERAEELRAHGVPWRYDPFLLETTT